MDFSIFDLYSTGSSQTSAQRNALNHTTMLIEKRRAESPDSMRWDDSEDSADYPAPVPENAAIDGCERRRLRLAPPPKLDAGYVFKGPLLALKLPNSPQERNKLPGIARTSVYGPVRNWPKHLRASRCFETSHCYQDNLKLLEHFHRGERLKGLQRLPEEAKSSLKQSATQPKLQVPQVKRPYKSMPSDFGSRSFVGKVDEKLKPSIREAECKAFHQRQSSLVGALLEHSGLTSADSTPQRSSATTTSFAQRCENVDKGKNVLPGLPRKPCIRRTL